MKKSYLSHSLQDTKNIAKEISNFVNNGDVILLNGDIGAGKTTFTKFLLEFLGVTSVVSSPTFTLLNEYNGIYPVYHFDMYRITDESELYELGFEDYINSKNSPFVTTGLTVIEWGENVKNIIPKEKTIINIKKIDESSREFELIKEN